MQGDSDQQRYLRYALVQVERGGTARMGVGMARDEAGDSRIVITAGAASERKRSLDEGGNLEAHMIAAASTMH